MSISKEELEQVIKDEKRKKALGEALSLIIVIVGTVWCCIASQPP